MRIPEGHVQPIFSHIDKDSNGVISESELVAFFLPVLRSFEVDGYKYFIYYLLCPIQFRLVFVARIFLDTVLLILTILHFLSSTELPFFPLSLLPTIPP
jgi:hypothetical protein